MSEEHAVSPLSLDEIRKSVRDAGLRCTAARLSVFEHLLKTSTPLTHAEVSEALASRGFDRATIYRNLTELTDAKLLSRVELGDRVWRFEVKRAGDDHFKEHPHFVCVDCGEVSCLPEVKIDLPAAKNKSATTPRKDITEILLRGHCGECS